MSTWEFSSILLVLRVALFNKLSFYRTSYPWTHMNISIDGFHLLFRSKYTHLSIECVWVDDFTNKNKLNLTVVGRRVEFQILSFEQHPFPRGIRSVLAVNPILNKCSKKSSSSSTKGGTTWQRMSCEFFSIPANWHFIENENWQRKLKSLQVDVSSMLHWRCLSWVLKRLDYNWIYWRKQTNDNILAQSWTCRSWRGWEGRWSEDNENMISWYCWIIKCNLFLTATNSDSHVATMSWVWVNVKFSLCSSYLSTKYTHSSRVKYIIIN